MPLIIMPGRVSLRGDKSKGANKKSPPATLFFSLALSETLGLPALKLGNLSLLRSAGVSIKEERSKKEYNFFSFLLRYFSIEPRPESSKL